MLEWAQRVMAKKLLLTFDYELFLGNRSGTPRECLLEPTEQLRLLAARYGVRLIFFVDTIYLQRLREEGRANRQCNTNLAQIEEQLRQLIQDGHYIFPHLHPHWLDAIYLAESNQWRLENSRLYRLHSIPATERRQLFASSLGFLEGIVRSVGGAYSLDAYRAGGWSIQPFADFAPLFREFGIRHDFSVAPRRWSFTDAHWFDFTAVRDAAGPYRFTEDVTQPAGNNGEFVEWPISFLNTASCSRRFDKLLRMTLYRCCSPKRGKGEILQAKALAHDLRRYPDLYALQLASPENFRMAFMPEYFRFARDNAYLHFIAHPKLLTAENFFWLDRLLAYLLKKFTVESDFRRMADA